MREQNVARTEWCFAHVFLPWHLCMHMNNNLTDEKADWFWWHKAPKISPPLPHQLCCYVSELFSAVAGRRLQRSIFQHWIKVLFLPGEKSCLPSVLLHYWVTASAKRQPEMKHSSFTGRSERRQSEQSGSKNQQFLKQYLHHEAEA